jgi:hypothetical protein
MVLADPCAEVNYICVYLYCRYLFSSHQNILYKAFGHKHAVLYWTRLWFWFMFKLHTHSSNFWGVILEHFCTVFNGIYYAGKEEWEYGYKRKIRTSFLKFRIICLSLVLPNFSGISYIWAFPIALWLELSFPTVRWGSISLSFIFWALVFNLYFLLHLNYGY